MIFGVFFSDYRLRTEEPSLCFYGFHRIQGVNPHTARTRHYKSHRFKMDGQSLVGPYCARKKMIRNFFYKLIFYHLYQFYKVAEHSLIGSEKLPFSRSCYSIVVEGVKLRFGTDKIISFMRHNIFQVKRRVSIDATGAWMI